MSAFNPEHAPATDADHGHHGDHPPHLAHHFDTPEQQYDSAKIGMWVFLATEILMFGGLFCAYAVYRYNNPDVFRYSEHHLNTWLGATNTIVLLASSLTMALAVRAAQLGQQTYLKLMLVMTLLGAVGFMVIKTIEYSEKFQHGYFPGRWSVYDRSTSESQARFAAHMAHVNEASHGDEAHGDEAHGGSAADHGGDESHADDAAHHGESDDAVGLEPAPVDDGNPLTSAGGGGSEGVSGAPRDIDSADHGDNHAESPRDPMGTQTSEDLARLGPGYVDPHQGTSDAALHRPAFNSPTSASVIASGGHAGGHATIEYDDLDAQDRQNIKAFFGIYYMMTGLHGVHVLVGMGLIGWVLIKSIAGTFGPKYFTPVDLVGLYWHIVDLIWIFLFPLLYLIH